MSISGSSPIQIIGELFTKGIAGAEKKTFQRRDAGSENLGDLLVRHPFVTPQHHGESLLLSKRSHGGLHGAVEFLIQYPAIGSRRGIGKLVHPLFLPGMGNDQRPASPP